METGLRAIAYVAFGSVCIAPFLFGAAERSIWIPLCQFWLGLGFVASLLRLRIAPSEESTVCSSLSNALLPLHALLVLQLIPMPGHILRWMSPGSWNAHFLPDPGDGRWRPLTVSPGATVEAWLYIAALQGVFLALQGIPREQRDRCLHALVAVAVILGAEGLWQSRSAHPHWLYGKIQYFAYSGLESGSFGPYFNRNHFATVSAMGAALAAGFAAQLARPGEGVFRIFRDSMRGPSLVLFLGISAFLALVTAASGSRSGMLALATGIAYVASRRVGKPQIVALLSLLALSAVLSGSFVIERLVQGDLAASRIPGWLDMLRVVRFFPVFGSGVGAFMPAYTPYQLQNTYEIWQHAHNEYLEWLIEGGLAGLLAASLVGLRVRQRLTIDGATRIAVPAAVLSFAVQCFFDFPARIPANAALVVCACAIAVRRRSSP